MEKVQQVGFQQLVVLQVQQVQMVEVILLELQVHQEQVVLQEKQV